MWEHCFLNTTTIVVRYRKIEQVHPDLHFMSVSNSEGALEAVGVLEAFSSPPFLRFLWEPALWSRISIPKRRD
jgi:hypothetical protein